MNHSRRSVPDRPGRLRLVAGLWCLRVALIGFVAYPTYRAIANSPILHSQRGDAELLKPGGGLLVALLDARSQVLEGLAVAVLFLLLVAVLLSWLASAIAWIVVNEGVAAMRPMVLQNFCRHLPKLAAVSFGSTTTTVLLGLGWWACVPLLGSALQSQIGERNTDYAQLLFLGVSLAAVAASLILADLMRTTLIRHRLAIGEALSIAWAAYRMQPIRISCEAGLRLAAAFLVQVANVWAIGHFQWLAQSTFSLLIAIATTEVAAIVAIWLRLDWVAWISATNLHLTPELPKGFP